MKNILKETFKKENVIVNGIVLIGCVLLDFVYAIATRKKGEA